MQKNCICFFAACALLLVQASTVQGVTLFGPEKYERTKGPPDIYNEAVTATAGTAALIIRNGAENDKHRVTSARVFMNGKEVLSPRDFKKKTHVLEVPVNMGAMNDIQVQLMGKPGTYFILEITRAVPPISLSVLEPAGDLTVTAPEILVQGVATNPAGNETGITVNGIPAQVHGDVFFVNNLALQDGENVIRVKALDSDGNTAETSVKVFFDAAEPFSWIEMQANDAAGLVPFNTTLVAETHLLFRPAGKPVLTISGPGTVAENRISATEIELEFTVPGVYTLTYAVTGGQDILLEKKIMVQALNREALASALTKKWHSMTNALMAGDVQQALSYFVAGSRARYEKIFSAMDSSKRKNVFGSISEIQIDSFYGRVVRCGAIRAGSRGTFSYPLTFVKDEDGIWKIMSF